MYCHNFQIVLLEVPGEISLCFSIAGCTMHCEGCHSPFLWKEGNGKLITESDFVQLLEKYNSLATCVLFMGGEWHESALIFYLKLAKDKNYKTCLYTGEENVSHEILKQLTWIKTGKWVQSLGGLESASTNQEFKEVATNIKMNYLFQNNLTYDTPY